MRLVRFVIPVLALLSLIARPLTAQGTTGTLRGQVVDSVTKQALAGVTVRIEGTQRETQTAPDGSFALADVPAGTLLVRATRIGFAPQQQTVTVTAGTTVEAPFALAP